MPIEVLMPALSPTMEEGNLAKWLKKEGDKVSSGDVIAEIETDKATMEVEATDEGTLGKIYVQEGTNGVKVNTLIAALLEEGEDSSTLDGFGSNEGKTKDEPKEKPAKEENPESNSTEEQKQQSAKEDTSNKQSSNKQSNERIAISPLAKRIANEKGVEISGIEGSGPRGRIIKQDVENANTTTLPQPAQAFTGRNPQESTLVPHSNMRKVIAKRLLESKQTVPHFYVSVEASVLKLNSARKSINSYLEQFGEKVSVNDIIIKCCANALRAHPGVNASWQEDGMVMYNNVDVSVAVGVEGGLITPIVKNADAKSIRTIAIEAKDLIKRARENKLSLEEFQGGGFSISNLGMYNVAGFNAIINPPQAAIIAIGGIKKVPKLCKKTESLCEDQVISLTLSCDHRVVDGVLAAEFLNTVKSFVENPNLLLL